MFAPKFVAEEMRLSSDYKKSYPEQFFVDKIDNRNLGYVRAGQPRRTKLIFVHGSPGNWGAFIRLIKKDSLRDAFDIYSVDRFGYGKSSQGGTERSLEAQARGILKLLEKGDPQQPVILVGHSYGGPVVSKMASIGDARIKTVMILAGSVDPDLEETKWYQYPADWMLFRWMIPNQLVVCNQEIMALKDELKLLDGEWSKISARVVVFQGEKDDLVPPGNADYIQKKMAGKNITIEKWADADHFLPQYHVEKIESAILKEGRLLN